MDLPSLGQGNGVIPVGSFDHDRVAHAAMTARRAARMSEVEASRREAEAVLERLLDQWRADDLASTTSAYLWDTTAMQAIRRSTPCPRCWRRSTSPTGLG